MLGVWDEALQGGGFVLSLLCLVGKLQIGSFQQELLLANGTHSLPSKCCFACGRVDECSVSFLIFTFSREKCHENFLLGVLRELRDAWPGEFYLSLRDPHGNNKIDTNYVLFSPALGKKPPQSTHSFRLSRFLHCQDSRDPVDPKFSPVEGIWAKQIPHSAQNIFCNPNVTLWCDTETLPKPHCIQMLHRAHSDFPEFLFQKGKKSCSRIKEILVMLLSSVTLDFQGFLLKIFL